jgi:hypothetical protein
MYDLLYQANSYLQEFDAEVGRIRRGPIRFRFWSSNYLARPGYTRGERQIGYILLRRKER